MSQHLRALALVLATTLLAPSIAADTTKPLSLNLKTPKAKLEFQPLKVKPFIFNTNYKPQPADMTGWSARTVGPTKGGGVFVQGKGRVLLIARGGDNSLNAAPLDPLGTKVVASNTWISLDQKSTSEPYCIGYETNWDKKETIIVCAFLGDQGNALYDFFWDSIWNGANHLGNASTPIDMGGKNAGTAPTILSKPSGIFFDTHIEIDPYEFGVWDGKSALYTRAYKHIEALNMVPETDWRKLNTPFTSAPGCTTDLCASHDSKRATVMVLKGDGSEPEIKAVSPRLAGISGKPALIELPGNQYALVVRGAHGLVHQIVYDGNLKAFSGGWKKEGGYIAEGSSPHCTAVNTQPVCIIQGGDGRLYSKGLATPSGL